MSKIQPLLQYLTSEKERIKMLSLECTDIQQKCFEIISKVTDEALGKINSAISDIDAAIFNILNLQENSQCSFFSVYQHLLCEGINESKSLFQFTTSHQGILNKLKKMIKINSTTNLLNREYSTTEIDSKSLIKEVLTARVSDIATRFYIKSNDNRLHDIATSVNKIE
jgi:hypothetical protein